MRLSEMIEGQPVDLQRRIQNAVIRAVGRGQLRGLKLADKIVLPHRDGGKMVKKSDVAFAAADPAVDPRAAAGAGSEMLPPPAANNGITGAARACEAEEAEAEDALPRRSATEFRRRCPWLKGPRLSGTLVRRSARRVRLTLTSGSVGGVVAE